MKTEIRQCNQSHIEPSDSGRVSTIFPEQRSKVRFLVANATIRLIKKRSHGRRLTENTEN
ncbi:MAG TPA: hypothetical protein VMB78_11440 [Dissulfurispiraceae bacterium]|nr:hypothetical protein [Dissulfurispiraceae bacterium]